MSIAEPIGPAEPWVLVYMQKVQRSDASSRPYPHSARVNASSEIDLMDLRDKIVAAAGAGPAMEGQTASFVLSFVPSFVPRFASAFVALISAVGHARIHGGLVLTLWFSGITEGFSAEIGFTVPSPEITKEDYAQVEAKLNDFSVVASKNYRAAKTILALLMLFGDHHALDHHDHHDHVATANVVKVYL